MQLTWQQSIGIEQSHLVPFTDFSGNQVMLHPAVKDDLNQLLKRADKDGVAISIVSAFRSFQRQLTIWNDKWQGYRPVYSRHGRPLNIAQMSEMEKYKAISLWSALPGLSRHHWGTDFDIFASAPIANGYQVQLQPEEFSDNGPCEQLEQWLSAQLNDLGFFRPYREFRQGVSVEPWHISHIQTADDIFTRFNRAACRDYLQHSAIQSSQFINHHFEHYFQNYFSNICEVDQ